MTNWTVHNFREDTPVFIYIPNFVHADRQARKLSEENASGVAEVRADGETVSVYTRGTKRYQGLRARQARAFNLPPHL